MSHALLDEHPEAVALLHEAAEWRLIALLFECPTGHWHEQVAAIASEVADGPLRNAAVAAAEATEGLYHTTCGPGGPAALREVSYRDNVLPGPLLADVRAFYDAFGYRPTLDEPSDHLAVEAGFVAYLLLKQAYAIMGGDAERAAVTREAASRFLRDHLANTVHPLSKLLANSGVRYLALACAAAARRVGPPAAQPEGLTHRLPVLDESDGCQDGLSE